MKKMRFMSILCLLLATAFLLLTACNGTSNSANNGKGNDTSDSRTTNSATNEMIDYIENGEYKKAIDFYNNDIAGNYSLESEVTEEIEQILENIGNSTLNGDVSAKDAEKVTTVIDRVLAETTIYIENYDEYITNIDAAIASKAAYAAGQELEQLENYVAAIAEYKKVIIKDSNHSNAAEAIERCSNLLKQKTFDEAKTFADKNQYADALKVLKDLSEILPDDSEVLSKITVYEQTYINNAISEAKSAFIEPSDYEAAINIINSALQQLPDEPELLKEKEYYLMFQPVNLYDIKPFAGSLHKDDNDKDSRGNEYSKCLIILNECTAKYELSGNYNKLKMTVYGRDEHTEAYYGTLDIYGDGNLLYSNQKVAINGKAFEIEIDVTGVDELTIDAYGYTSVWTDCYGITNAILTRTTK